MFYKVLIQRILCRMSFFFALRSILIFCVSVEVRHQFLFHHQFMKYSLTNTGESFFQFHGKSWLTKYTLLQSLMGGIFINTFLLIIVSPGTQIKMLVLKSFSRKLSNLFGPGVHYRIPGRRSRISQCHK